jgi:hypothetical protein
MRNRVGMMNAVKSAMAIGRAKVRAKAATKAVLGAGLEKGGWRSSKGSSKSGRLGQVETGLTESGRVLRAVRPGGVGMMTAPPSEVQAGRIKGKSGTSRNVALVAKAARPRGPRNLSLP